MPQIGGLISAIGTLGGGGGLLNSIVGRLLVSVAASALLAAVTPKPKQPGLTTEVTQTGGDNPASFILGLSATAGAHMCPPMSHGKVGKAPNGYLTYVIDVGDLPGQQLQAVFINGHRHTLTGTAAADAHYGVELAGEYAGWAFVKYYDGSQTTADAGLLAKYGSYGERPWLSDMVGEGLCYAIVTFKYNRELFTGFPQVLFELESIPLYDPRLDDTVGGTGDHRWDDPSTWEATRNAAVIIYNAMRGIALPGGDVWGGRATEEELPFLAWTAAMDDCDEAVDDGDGGTEPAWRAGLEVTTDKSPSDVILDIARGAAIQLAEVGGEWAIRVGPPALPIFTLTDDRIMATRPEEHAPFPGLDRTINAVHATYPDPDQVWADHEAPPLTSPTFETADGGRRLPASLQLGTVPFSGQVQRLMSAYLAEERRFRRHVLAAGAAAAILGPLDCLAWTSEEHGYDGKVFEVHEVSDDVHSAVQHLSLRERDAGDWTPPDIVLPAPVSGGEVVPDPVTVTDFAVEAFTGLDSDDIDRRSGFKMTWDGDEQGGVTGMVWQARFAGKTYVAVSGSTQNIEAGELIVVEGVIPNQAYEVRARFIGRFPTVWTDWEDVTTPPVYFTAEDLAPKAVTEDGAAFLASPLLVLVGTSSADVVTGVTVDLLEGPTIWEFAVQFAPTVLAGASGDIAFRLRYSRNGGALQTVEDAFTEMAGISFRRNFSYHNTFVVPSMNAGSYEFKLVVARNGFTAEFTVHKATLAVRQFKR